MASKSYLYLEAAHISRIIMNSYDGWVFYQVMIHIPSIWVAFSITSVCAAFFLCARVSNCLFPWSDYACKPVLPNNSLIQDSVVFSIASGGMFMAYCISSDPKSFCTAPG